MQNSSLKLTAPKLTSKTTFLSFDVETNGIHGAAFAVGAVLMQADGKLLSSFSGRCPIRGRTHPWVKKYVIPELKELKREFNGVKAMREAFWQWYVKNKTKADFVVVNNGYPIEARWLLAAQADDLDTRAEQHPYPLLELNSLLLAAGIKPLADKNSFVSEEMAGQAKQHHNPLWDAKVAVTAAVKALTITGQIVI